MALSRAEMKNLLTDWFKAWDNYDIEGVMGLFHDDIVFDNWTGGRAEGKEELGKAWGKWFENHGNFRFTDEDLFIDEDAQKALYQWQLDWPSPEKGFQGKQEKRRGVDIIHFSGNKIIKKLTYSKTTIEIDGNRHSAGYIK